MDWLLEGSLLSNSETDLANVFEYEPRSVKVVQLDDEDKVRQCTDICLITNLRYCRNPNSGR